MREPLKYKLSLIAGILEIVVCFVVSTIGELSDRGQLADFQLDPFEKFLLEFRWMFGQ